MKPFNYERASSVAEAASAAREGAEIIAGGTNLLDLMKLEIARPARLVDISRIGEEHRLHGIEKGDGGGCRIGALVSNSALANDKRIRTDYPVLSRAILSAASVQLRNMATTAGNLMQRTRCSYFYDTDMQCNKRQPGSGCAALNGQNRMHAIIGASENCIAVHPSDMAVAMRALDAQVEIVAAAGGAKHVDLGSFYCAPGSTPHIETILELDDVITGIVLPPPRGFYQSYRKVRDRSSFAFSLVSVACVVQLEDDRIVDVAIACGGIAPMPWRDSTVEQLLRGRVADMDLFAEAAEQMVEHAVGYGHNDFKIPLLKRTLVAVLCEVCGIGDR